MADLFGNRGFWQDSGCLSTEKKEDKTEDSDLVLICFQISVWSGTTTEQTSIEEGAEFMKRRRIIPGVMLKPFLDFRARAKALCQEMGEPYLNGFVMRRQDAAVAERALSVWRKEFCRRRDEFCAGLRRHSCSEARRHHSSGLFEGSRFSSDGFRSASNQL